MSMGGGGDPGKAARKAEEERQARVNASVSKINDIFDSKPVTQVSGQVAAFDPNATYYDEFGKKWDAPTTTRITPGSAYDPFGDSEASRAWQVVTDYDNKAINDLIKQGRLYSNVTTTTPTKTREQLYAEQKQAIYDLNKTDVDKQYKDAERQNRFGLARAGLLGGSVDVDSNARLQEVYSKGLMQATGLADQAASDLKTQDERARQSLISLAQSGVDTGTAQASALRQLDATTQAAEGARGGAAIGDLFGGMSQAYLLRQQQAGLNAGRANASQWYGVSNPRTGDSGQVA